MLTEERQMPVKVWVIPWYREQDWSEWCFICKFKGSHKEWVARAEAEAKVQESLGYNVGQIVIEPHKLMKWSRINGGKIDNEARMTYAISLVDARNVPPSET